MPGNTATVAAWRENVVQPATLQPGQRPSSAQQPKSGTAPGKTGQLRPLGPAPPAALKPSRGGGAGGGGGGGGGGRGYIAQVKGAILRVQRAVDTAKLGREAVTEVSPEMRSLEQKLLGVQYDEDPLQFSRSQVVLLETLLRGLTELTSHALARARKHPSLRHLCPTPTPTPDIGMGGTRVNRPSTAPAARPASP
eukprot:Hpha_TRINITY_DN14638_c0_g1::TRINITY_DN14638_c0_g1_i1::g.48516::m.48516